MDEIGSSDSECSAQADIFSKLKNASNHDSIDDCIPCEPLSFNPDPEISSVFLALMQLSSRAQIVQVAFLDVHDQLMPFVDCQRGKFSDFMNLPECKTPPGRVLF